MSNYVKIQRSITACFPRTLPDESFGGKKIKQPIKQSDDH